jgi:predicted enzyme related to lactoylglutathione lyase
MAKIPALYLRNFLITILLGLSLSSCSKVQLAPIPSNPDGTHNTGQIVWHDFLTSDVESAKTFYGKLLGWHFEQKGKYLLILNNNTPIGGMVELQPEQKVRRSGGWITYFSIPEIDETALWIEKSGGKILMGPGKMRNRGYYATLADPNGAPLVIIDLKDGDPLKDKTQSGDWLWDELWTSDIERAVEFYQNLAGYTAQSIQADGAPEYWVMRDETDQMRAGITQIPFENLPDQWVPVVRVAEPLKVVGKVQGLGGTVIIPPDHALSDGTVALIKDPTGGIIMIESWKPKTQ